MDTLEKGREISRILAEIDALTAELDTLLGSTPERTTSGRSAPKNVIINTSPVDKTHPWRKVQAPMVRKCGICGKAGHSRRTCTGTDVDVLSPTDTEEGWTPPAYPEDKYANEIRELHAEGMSDEDIALELDIPIQLVKKALKIVKI